MTATPSPSTAPSSAEKAITLALRLAHAENALHALTLGQVDAIVDPNGRAYLLRPAQEHLRQRESRLLAVIESLPDVITVVNRDGVILSQSRAVRRVFGYGSEELVGSNFFDHIHEHDVPRLHSAFFNVIEEFLASATVQFRHRTSEGSFRAIEATVARLRDVTTASVVFSLRPFIEPIRLQPHPDNSLHGSPSALS
jgi:PAS domain S-box-containing protein